MFIIHTTVSATWKGDRYHKDQEDKTMLQMSPYLLKNLAFSQKLLLQPRKPVVQETSSYEDPRRTLHCIAHHILLAVFYLLFLRVFQEL
jgi:hypothetical protein